MKRQQLLKFEVMGREDVESAAAMRVSYAIISIHDPDRRPARLRTSGLCRGVLRLAFHDAEPSNGFMLPEHIRLLTEQDATAICGFIAEHRASIEKRSSSTASRE